MRVTFNFALHHRQNVIYFPDRLYADFACIPWKWVWSSTWSKLVQILLHSLLCAFYWLFFNLIIICFQLMRSTQECSIVLHISPSRMQIHFVMCLCSICWAMSKWQQFAFPPLWGVSSAIRAVSAHRRFPKSECGIIICTKSANCGLVPFDVTSQWSCSIWELTANKCVQWSFPIVSHSASIVALLSTRFRFLSSHRMLVPKNLTTS